MKKIKSKVLKHRINSHVYLGENNNDNSHYSIKCEKVSILTAVKQSIGVLKNSQIGQAKHLIAF